MSSAREGRPTLILDFSTSPLHVKLNEQWGVRNVPWDQHDCWPHSSLPGATQQSKNYSSSIMILSQQNIKVLRPARLLASLFPRCNTTIWKLFLRRHGNISTIHNTSKSSEEDHCQPHSSFCATIWQVFFRRHDNITSLYWCPQQYHDKNIKVLRGRP